MSLTKFHTRIGKDLVDDSTTELENGRIIVKDSGITTDKLNDSAVTKEKIENMSSMTVLGNITGVASSPNEIGIITETAGIDTNDNDTSIPTSAAVKDYVEAVTSTYQIVKRKRVEYSGQKSTTTTVTWNTDILPTWGEGELLLQTNFTPTSTNNRLRIKFEGLITLHNAGYGIKLMLFEGTTCVGAYPYLQASNGNAPTNISFEFTPSSTSETTYTLRWGVGGSTGYINRWGAYDPTYGGLVKSYLTIEEIEGSEYEVYTN